MNFGVPGLNATAQNFRHSSVVAHLPSRHPFSLKRTEGSAGGKNGEAEFYQPPGKRNEPSFIRNTEKSQQIQPRDRRAVYQSLRSKSTRGGRGYFELGGLGGSASVASRSFIKPPVSTCRIRSRVRFMISPPSSSVMPPFSATSSAQVYCSSQISLSGKFSL